MSVNLIGIFDSGIGGTSFISEITKQIPKTSFIYFADRDNFPYGEKSANKISKIAIENTKLLLNSGASLILVACNTATVHSIGTLREIFPEIPFVGVEPAIKPASKLSQKGIIVLSTKATTNSQQLNNLINKYAKDKNVLKLASNKLVEDIENQVSAEKITKRLAEIFKNINLDDYDVLVLGCTHFPIIKAQIEEYVGENIKVVDSTEAVVKQIKRLLKNPE